MVYGTRTIILLALHFKRMISWHFQAKPQLVIPRQIMQHILCTSAVESTHLTWGYILPNPSKDHLKNKSTIL